MFQLFSWMEFLGFAVNFEPHINATSLDLVHNLCHITFSVIHLPENIMKINKLIVFFLFSFISFLLFRSLPLSFLFFLPLSLPMFFLYLWLDGRGADFLWRGGSVLASAATSTISLIGSLRILIHINSNIIIMDFVLISSTNARK